VDLQTHVFSIETHSMRRRAVIVGFLSFLCATIAANRPVFAATVESLGDATIDNDPRTGSWTVTAGRATMSFGLNASQNYTVTSILSPTGTEWIRTSGPDTIVTADGASHEFGNLSQGFGSPVVSTRRDERRLELDIAYTLQPQNLVVTRHIAVVSGSPTFEVWTSFQVRDQPVAVSNIRAFHATVAPSSIHWLTGEQLAASGGTPESSFTRQQRTLAVGDTFSLGSAGRSSELSIPWFSIDGAGDQLYSALMWSGQWSLTATRSNAGLSIDWSLPGVTTTIAGTTAVDGPHALIGVARGALTDAAAALRSYVIDGLRNGRAFTPLVTYNTWFAYGTRIDEASMRSEIARAATMGVELFVVDAGWYTGADTRDPRDFTPGLGSWEADPERFPNGLKSLTDYAHSLGLKFGVWVEPERVNLSVVGRNGLDESSLAQANGSYGSDETALVCLAGRAGRQWVLDRLTELIDAVQPDYLKWDNNLWLNCNRDGHGHGAGDGGFAHVNALYGILDTIRRKYPSLAIENCSGGGNRLDLGMIQYTDVAWMDDRKAPSVLVRHNIDGLSLIFPPAYLLSFLTNLGWEPLHDSPDLRLYVRSRMPAVLGLCFQSAWISDDDRDAIAEQIALYKRLRPTLATATTTLLTDQPDGSGGPAWEALQETGTNGSVLMFVFDSGDGPGSATVSPNGLDLNTVYQVISADAGVLDTMTGADLMARRIRIVRSSVSGAHVLTIVPQS